MGQIINSVCLCHSVCPSVCMFALSRSHFLIDFRQNWYGSNNPKDKNEFVGGSTSHHPFPYFAPKTATLSQKVMKIHANFCLKCSRIAEIPALHRKFGPRNTMMTSDFRPEVEIRQVRACALKRCNITILHECLLVLWLTSQSDFAVKCLFIILRG